MSSLNEAVTGRLPIPPKFPMEPLYMLSMAGLTPAQMKELTIRYITYLKEITQAEAALYGDYLEVLDKLESKV
jgi:preprotein translocase subunit Sec63